MNKMSFLELVILVFVPLLLATPLPLCPDDVFSESYLLPKKQLLACGLPLSRSYLLSRFNAAVIINTSVEFGTFFSKRNNKLTISVCRPPTSLRNVWLDDISVAKRTPWDVETCKEAELNLYTRLISHDSIEPAFIRPLDTPDRCDFLVEFIPKSPGVYSIEVINNWLGASTDPNPISADIKQGYRWTGNDACVRLLMRNYIITIYCACNAVLMPDGDRYHIPGPLLRGSIFITSCQDMCSMTAKCEYWTSNGQGINCCQLFSGRKVPTLQKVEIDQLESRRPSRCQEPLVSGLRKRENFTVYLGGFVSTPKRTKKFPNVDRAVCRQQSHAANSPLTLRVQSLLNDMEPILSFEKCSRLQVLATGIGHWQAFDETKCYNSTRLELDTMKVLPKTLLQEAYIDGAKYEMYQDQATLSVYYVVTRANGDAEYSFRAPQVWFPELTITPPWQLNPRCTLGAVAVPPKTMDPKGVFITVISFAYVHNALTGYEYISPENCQFRHYSRGRARECLSRGNISAIVTSGMHKTKCLASQSLFQYKHVCV